MKIALIMDHRGSELIVGVIELEHHLLQVDLIELLLIDGV
jgi:hypothetical protein